MIFAADGPHGQQGPVRATPAEAWDGLDWQPGTWWPVAGIS